MPIEKASALPAHHQQLLYCCAFWVMAADEELQGEEQSWLIHQFGEQNAAQLLEDCLALSGDAFLITFDDMVNGLTETDRQDLYPNLPSWLEACAAADGGPSDEEREIIGQILQRLQLQPEPEPAKPFERAQAVTAAPKESAWKPDGTTVLSGHTGDIVGLVGSDDGRYAWSASRDGTARRWDLDKAREDRCLTVSEHGVKTVALLEEGTLLTLDQRGTLALLPGDESEPTWQVAISGSPSSLAVDPSGQQAALALLRGAIAIVNTRDGTVLRSFKENRPAAMRAVTYSPNGNLLAGGGDGKVITVWDAGGGAVRATLTGHEAMVTSLRFAPDSRRLFSASRDNSVRMWDVESGERLRTYEGHSFSVYDIAVSDDGTRMASASGDHTIRVWDIESGQTRARYEDTAAGFNCVTFVAGSRRLLGGGAGQVVYVLDGSD